MAEQLNPLEIMELYEGSDVLYEYTPSGKPTGNNVGNRVVVMHVNDFTDVLNALRAAPTTQEQS